MAASLVDLLGDKLQSKSGEVSTAEALAGKKAIALYFSAHWCPPCRGFTPQLSEWYIKDLKAKGLEIVFVSSDNDEDAFKEYFGEMPWLAVPYADRSRAESFDKKFKVSGIPTIVVLDGEGKTITTDGRAAISSDPTGEEMPWKPKSLQDILDGAKLIGQDGNQCGADALTGKVYAFYFSAHWCPPCRGFTPKLTEWYKKDLKAKGLEIVFVSSDRDEDAFKEYFGEMPWLALDFSDRKRKEQLSNLFGVQGIPTVTIIDKDGSVITKDGRASISGDPTGSEFPWHPKPVSNLKTGAGQVNELPTVIALCETCETSVQQSSEAAMEPLAIKYKDEAKASGEEDPKFVFMIATEGGGVAGQLRQMTNLPALPPSKHEHPLEKKEAGGGWGCDGCGCSGAGKERYRCTQGCDWDFCGECNAKAGEKVAKPPKLMLFDIPDNGGFYEGPEGEITSASISAFVEGYLTKALERKQLG